MIKAKFTNKTKQDIFERDGGRCIICGTNQGILDFHHCYYGTQSNYGEDRNNANQGVLLCREHHQEAHSFKPGYGIRQDAIKYLENYG